MPKKFFDLSNIFWNCEKCKIRLNSKERKDSIIKRIAGKVGGKDEVIFNFPILS